MKPFQCNPLFKHQVNQLNVNSKLAGDSIPCQAAIKKVDKSINEKNKKIKIKKTQNGGGSTKNKNTKKQKTGGGPSPPLAKKRNILFDEADKKTQNGGEIPTSSTKLNILQTADNKPKSFVLDSGLRKSQKKKKLSKIIIWNKGNGCFAAKKDELETIIQKHSPIIFGLMEANMAVDEFEPALQVQGYSLERDNLSKEGIRTRTAVYVSDQITYTRRLDLEIPNTPLIWLEVKAKLTKSWLICIGYRQWRRLNENKKISENMTNQQARFAEWTKSWTLAQLEGKDMIITGDLNIDVMPWVNPQFIVTPYQASKATLLKLLKTTANILNLDLIKTAPTRYQGSDAPSILDIVLTNCPLQIPPPLLLDSTSDHKIVLIQKKCETKMTAAITRKARSYKHYTKARMLQNLDIPRLNQLLFSEDPNYVAEALVCELNRALDIVAPTKVIQIRKNYAAHLTESTKQIMANRDQLKGIALASKKEEDMQAYKKRRNEALKHQRKDKAKWAADMLVKEGNTSKNLWQMCRKISGQDEQKAISSLTIDGIANNKVTDIAEALNKHFVTKVEKLVKEMPPQQIDLLQSLKETPTPEGEQLQLMSITQQQLNEQIKCMKKNAASGSDTITGIVLNDVYQSIQQILLHLINLSLGEAIYPNVFKVTKVIPQVKTGKDPMSAQNYRPISNLCIIGKHIEKAFFTQMSAFIKKKNIIHPHQHGGRTGHSTTTCILGITQNIQRGINAKLKTALLALDLSAAYDLCDHPILLQKCRLYNMGKQALKFIESFLVDRSQYVHIGSSQSTTLKTGPKGVVQGGESSGELFTLYLNDLPGQVNGGNPPSRAEDSQAEEYVDDVNV